ncbi:peptidoglycan-binding domain-containing protein [Streptomyces actuosus]|uniref:peptidoglycan-binding domain-containing protein n=1 Tax=Streptomyces actuosus TaxID=1885 RepID=UPI0027DA7E98|nr:peptidoglycan-binding protein [Streptomyces actuosus]
MDERGTGPQARQCPECGAPRGADNTPSCACGQRASDALRDARSAEQAAVEDFDPLRIRPYVELEDTANAPAARPTGSGRHARRPQGDTPGAGAAGGAGARAAAGSADAVDETMALRAVAPSPRTPAPQPPGALDASGAAPAGTAAEAAGTTAPARTPDAAGPAGAVEETMALRAVPPSPSPRQPGPTAAADVPDATAVLPAPLAPPVSPPNATDLSLFEGAGAAPGRGADLYGLDGRTRGRRGRKDRARRRGVVLGVSGAVAGVVAVAGLASGLFSYESPSRDDAASKDVRAAVPDTTTSAAQEPASPTASTASASASSASPSPSSSSASPSASPSESASESNGSPAPSRSAPSSPDPAVTASTSTATASEPAPALGPSTEAPVLRRGDKGPEVTELQLRLRELRLYGGDVNGRFNGKVEDAVGRYQRARGIRSDPLGVYGPETRSMLEAETREP